MVAAAPFGQHSSAESQESYLSKGQPFSVAPPALALFLMSAMLELFDLRLAYVGLPHVSLLIVKFSPLRFVLIKIN